MIRTHAEVYSFARYAGQVTRFHNWPVHRQQSVGEHTWQMLRIYESIWGPIPPHTTSAILWHDAGELFVGDISHPAKAAHPDLKRAADTAEAVALRNMRRGPTFELTPSEKLRLRMVDMIDVYEFSLVEMEMGNAYAEPIVRTAGQAMDDIGLEMSVQDAKIVAEYVAKVQERFSTRHERS